MRVDISRGKPVVDNRLKRITEKYFNERKQEEHDHEHCCCGHHHEGVEHNADNK